MPNLTLTEVFVLDNRLNNYQLLLRTMMSTVKGTAHRGRTQESGVVEVMPEKIDRS
jgi:hypothetical protein